MSSGQYFEQLEQRTFLSAVVGSVVTAPALATTSATTAAATVVPKLYLKTYAGTGKLNDTSGTIYLKITSIVGSKVAATLYSNDWGGINVAVTGKVTSAGVVTLSGKNTMTNIKQLRCSIIKSNMTLSGTIKGAQMGVSGSGSIAMNRLSKTPRLATVKWPGLVGSYKGSASGDSISLKITRQTKGCVWGTANGSPTTGFALASGEFYMFITESDGTTLVHGFRSAKGVLTGGWQWTGKDGSSDGGTFRLPPA